MSKRGFSIIELMVGITIVGIIAAAAIPSYRKYLIKSRVAEMISYGDTVKKEILIRYNRGETMPASGQEATWGYSRTGTPTNFVNGVWLEPSWGGDGSCPNSGTKISSFLIDGNASNIGVSGYMMVMYLICYSENYGHEVVCGYPLNTGPTGSGNHIYLPKICSTAL